jgi:pimeloyl-ACP methyl ester carboxylesterase
MNIRCLLLVVLCGTAACSTVPYDLRKQAAHSEFTSRSVIANGFTLEAWYSREIGRSEAGRQYVYIEGDGRPWSADGQSPTADPTPVNALAFELMRESAMSSLYLTRPCYFGNLDEKCVAANWTASRFSPEVVDAMAEAIVEVTEPGRPVVLIGYSGGGALAMLLAEEVATVTAVVTVAGLLDTSAWIASHGYDPLQDSLNPADVDLPVSVRQIHLVGGLDSNIPPDQTRAALAQSPRALLWVYDEFDHVCCWVDSWQDIRKQIESELNQSPRND